MKRLLLFAGAFFLLHELLEAAPVVDAGTYYILPGTSGQIAVMVSGSPADQVAGLDLYLQIGDGGPENSAPDAGPVFSGPLDVIGAGTVFGANNDGAATGQLGQRIRSALTLTSSGTVQADGTLALIQVNTAVSDVGQWALKLSGVANNAYPPNGLTTDFADESIIPTLQDGELRVWNIHTLTWSKNANGNWDETGSWTATPGGYPAHSPNITVNAVIDTPYVVTANNGRANAIMVSSGDLEASGSLQATTGLTVQSNGIVNLAAGSTLTTPAVSVLSGGQLTLPSLSTNSLAIGSGGRVTISASAGAPLSTASLNAVPEPSTLILIITLLISVILTSRRIGFRT